MSRGERSKVFEMKSRQNQPECSAGCLFNDTETVRSFLTWAPSTPAPLEFQAGWLSGVNLPCVALRTLLASAYPCPRPPPSGWSIRQWPGEEPHSQWGNAALDVGLRFWVLGGIWLAQTTEVRCCCLCVDPSGINYTFAEVSAWTPEIQQPRVVWGSGSNTEVSLATWGMASWRWTSCI